MLGERLAPTGATILDLHSIRAGLAPAAAALDQGEALRRQRASGTTQKIPGEVSVGDKVIDPETGEVGMVIRLRASTVFVQFRGRRAVFEIERLRLAGEVELPCDCEATS